MCHTYIPISIAWLSASCTGFYNDKKTSLRQSLTSKLFKYASTESGGSCRSIFSLRIDQTLAFNSPTSGKSWSIFKLLLVFRTGPLTPKEKWHANTIWTSYPSLNSILNDQPFPLDGSGDRDAEPARNSACKVETTIFFLPHVDELFELTSLEHRKTNALESRRFLSIIVKRIAPYAPFSLD